MGRRLGDKVGIVDGTKLVEGASLGLELGSLVGRGQISSDLIMITLSPL